VLAVGVILLLNYYHPFVYANVLLIGIGLIPLQTLVNWQLETARTTKDVTLAYAPSKIIWPVLVVCGAFLVLETTDSLTGNLAIAIAQIALLFVLLFQFGLLWLKFNQEFEASQPVYALREWLSVAVVMLLQHACLVILFETDTIMVGSLLEPKEAGMYAVAAKTAEWVSFVLTLINIIAGPYFAALYAKNDLEGLQKLVSVVALWIFWPSVTLSFFLIIFSQPILSIFGSDFIAANGSLKFLVLAHLIDSLCGSVGFLMMMTGHQNKSLAPSLFAALLNIGLNAIAIPLIGAVGAADRHRFLLCPVEYLAQFFSREICGSQSPSVQGIFATGCFQVRDRNLGRSPTL